MLRYGQDVKIHDGAIINVEDGYIGDRTVIGNHARIEGRFIHIGNEAWIDEFSHIAGGSAFDPESNLTAGDFLHMGRFSHLNQGRGLKIGHEFGCGMNTKVFTHGSYESVWDGFPVQWKPVSIGDRVWLPCAWVNPGVSIGDNVVVAAMSLVNSDLPSGCLAGGIPCRVIKENAYPRTLSREEKTFVFERIFSEASKIYRSRNGGLDSNLDYIQIDEDVYDIGTTVFDIALRKIEGAVTPFSEILKNQLRRNGIRFRYRCVDGTYSRW